MKKGIMRTPLKGEENPWKQCNFWVIFTNNSSRLKNMKNVYTEENSKIPQSVLPFQGKEKQGKIFPKNSSDRMFLWQRGFSDAVTDADQTHWPISLIPSN